MPTRMIALLALSLTTLGGAAAQSRDSARISTTAPSDYADDAVFAPFQRVTNDMTPPKATHSPDAQFPALPADAEQQSGAVIMLVGVNAKGQVEPVRVLRSSAPAFEKSAVDTVKKWKFKPAKTKAGQPVPVQITVEMMFRR